jgi:Protein of unknown function (DUF3108)
MNAKSRRYLMLFALLAMLWSGSVVSASEALPLESGPLGIFLQRELAYDISFLWFDRLAAARLRFLPTGEPGSYRAVLEAHTRGVAAWLTKDREQRYESIMTRDAAGRFHSQRYSSAIYKGRGGKRSGRTKTYRYDFEQKLVHISVDRGGVVTEGKPLQIEAGPEPSDMLTTFINFMAGNYGKLHPGETLVVPTFTTKGFSDIVVTVLQPEQHLEGFPRGGTLCRIKVDQEVFDTGGGYVYAWFNDEMVPVIGMVEDVLNMGNVRGDLRP